MELFVFTLVLAVNSVYSAVSLSASKGVSCCKNGGVCVLGSFCKCPKFFTGRYCEIEKKIEEKFKDCKNVPHGYWIRSDCDKCRCYNGTVVCVPKYYFGCDDDDEPLDPTKKVDPFRGKTITLFAKDPDVHYSLTPSPLVGSYIEEDYQDDYYYIDNMAASASAAFIHSFVLSVSLIVHAIS
uniref:Uncharacterized protein LOC111121557 n=1 Tax=Crassostrea virginica TaxID=6565 RepID=A0A8B8CS84_CRAVI|nr:uncharacterized protein LOC111121557 [Crassostrea virginica]